MTNPKVESDHPVHQAIVVGDIKFVSEYLANGGSPNVLDRYDCEPLFTAVKYDQLEGAKMLLAAGGNIFRRSKLRGDPFGTACANWNVRMIEFCVGAGVDVNQADSQGTILDWLASQKQFIADENLTEWQAMYDKLVVLGARHTADL